MKQRRGFSELRLLTALREYTCSVDDGGLVLVVEVEGNELPPQTLKRDGISFLILERKIRGKLPRVEAMKPGKASQVEGNITSKLVCFLLK